MKRHFLGVLLLLHIFFMFYNLESWAPFGWDQVDNAWTAMRIITEHTYPLVGMVAKQNTGIYIGPLYYYYVAFFYFLTGLDPIAAPLIAGVTSIISFFGIYFVASRLFSRPIALVSVLIYTCSSFIISSERVQWPVNFIPLVSLLLFYYLSKIVKGETKYCIHLGALIGLSFHIHFTSIFYPIIILFTLPIIPKWNIKHISLGVAVCALFFIPQAIYYLQNNSGQAFSQYLQTSYHGFHLRRVLQLLPDAFIKFQSILMNPYGFIQHISFIFVPIILLLLRNKLAYLIALWFAVPWFAFATYSGEISDYYFSQQTYLAIIILAYLTFRVPKALGILFWGFWIVANVYTFTKTQDGNLLRDRMVAQEASKTARIINFTQGDPQSYMYYYYMYKKGEWLPYKL